MPERGRRMVSAGNLAIYLHRIDYPVSKDDIVDQVEDLEAPDEIIRFVEQLPDREYTGILDVLEETDRLG